MSLLRGSIAGRVTAAAVLLLGAALIARIAGTDAPAGHAQQVAGAPATALTHWTMREDHADRGLARRWQRGGFSGAAVTVPSTLRANAYKGAAGVANYAGSVAWYETSFQAPQAGAYALDFASASFLASVWVDGSAVGSHRGAYLPFSFTRRLAAGAHVLVVRIDWRDPERQAREGFHRTWFNWGGLNGPVEVRQLGASELTSPTLQTTVASHGAVVRVSVQVRNDGPQRTLQPEGSLARGAQRIALTFPTLQLAHGQSATATTTATVAAPALWSPRAPSLYRLQLAVGEESSYAAQVGLRQLAWRSGRLYLNGQRLLLHGATLQQDVQGHGDALTPGDEDALVAELQAIGANAVRAQHPLPASLLERLDAAGVLVWQGIGPVEGAGSWHATTPALLAQAEQQARTAALAEQLHPSVIDWNLVDEVARNGQGGAEVAYVRTLTRWLHAHDPGRMVSLDVWGTHAPTAAGAIYAEADAVAETDYTGWYEDPQEGATQLGTLMRARLAAMARTFPGKVLVISEFGAEANALNPSSAPGGYGFQTRLLAQHIAVYRADPSVSGMFVWLLRDYPLNPRFQGGSVRAVLPHVRLIEGLNGKGLFTYSGVAKPAVTTVARLFRALPSG